MGKNGFYEQLEANTRKHQFEEVELSPKQEAYLDSNEEEIISTFSTIRKKIDFDAFYFLTKKIIEAGETKKTTPKLMQTITHALEKYPYGYCRNIVLSGIKTFEQEETHTALNEKNIPFKRVYGIDKGELYNTIQLGDRILSITDDKHIFNNHNIHITPYPESSFHTIKKLEELVSILKDYWQVEVFNTSTIPEIGMTHPYVLKNKEGELFFDTIYSQHIYFDETQSDFSQVKKYMDNSETLSKEDSSKLHTKIIAARNKAQNDNEIVLSTKPKIYYDDKGKEQFSELLEQRLEEGANKEFYDHIMYAINKSVIKYLQKQ